MAQPPFLTDVLQIEPASGDVLTIERDPLDGSLLFKDALVPDGLRLSDLAGLNSIQNVSFVGVSGPGATYNTIQEALDNVPATSSIDNPSLILVGPGTYSENLTLEKDGVFLIGLGSVRLEAALAASTLKISPTVTTTPLGCHVENFTLANAFDGEACVELDGTADLTLLSEGLTLAYVNLESTGAGGYTILSALTNRVTVLGGTWGNSSSTSSLSFTQTAALTLQDIAEVGDLNISYTTLTPPIPSVYSADYRLTTLGKVGDVAASLGFLGTFDMTGCTDVGHVVLGGNRTFDFTASRIGNLTLNDTVTAQLLSTSLLVVTGTGTLLIWDGSSYAPPNQGGPQAGEVNTASNVGTSGEGLVTSKLGVDLQFKNIAPGSSKVTVINNVGDNTVEIDVDGTQLDHTQLLNKGTHTHFNIDTHIDNTANPHGVTPAQIGLESVASISYLADEFLDVSAADWAISTPAIAQADTNNNALRVRAFDDTIAEGVGFLQKISYASSTELIFRWSSRAETLPGVPVQVLQRLYFRELGDNTAITSWSFVDMAAIDFQTNVYFQIDIETLSFTDFSPTLLVGKLYQFELVRHTASAVDTLSGDWDLLQLIVEVN